MKIIDKIENYSYKSFHNFNSSECPFYDVNYIYGKNGRGKSSLARGIVKEFEKINKKVAIYDTNYISDYLLLDSDPGRVTGVKAIFGSSNINYKKQVNTVESEIKEINDKIDGLNADIKEYNVSIINHISEIHDRMKGDSSVRKKNLKNIGIEGPEVCKDTFRKDLKEGIEIGSEVPLTNEKVESRLNNLRGIVLPANPIIEVIDEDICSRIEKKYDTYTNIPEEILSWIGFGIKIHKDANNNSDCLFCGSGMSILEIENRYAQIINQEWKDTQNYLKNFQSKFHDGIESCKDVYNKLAIIIHNFDIDIEIPKIDFSFYYKHVKNLLEVKFKDPSDSISFSDDFINDYNEVCSSLKDLSDNTRSLIEKEKSNLEKYRNNKNDYIKNAIAREVLKDFSEGDLKSFEDLINEKGKELETCRSELNTLKDEHSTLLEKMSDYSSFASYLNHELEEIGIPVSITEDKINKGSYIIKNTQGNNLTIEDVSEGEKNILSLIYFYYSLFQDDGFQSIKDGVDAIVIDDPVSSLDDNNKLYILYLVRDLIDKSQKSGSKIQFFVLTHSWEDFYTLTYHRNKNPQKSQLLEVYKSVSNNGMTQNSQIREIDASENGPYKRLFNEVHKLSTQKLDELSDCQKYHSLNSMRRIFEEFLSYKSSHKVLPQVSHKSKIKDIYDRARSTQKEEPFHMGKKFEGKIDTLLSSINIMSHRAYGPEGDIVGCAKTLMRYIKEVDKVHYEEMLK